MALRWERGELTRKMVNVSQLSHKSRASNIVAFDMMKNSVNAEHNQMNNILCFSHCHRSVHKHHWYINQSTIRENAGKIFGAKNIRITPICAKLQGIFAKWHNLASSQAGVCTAQRETRRSPLHSLACLHFIWKFWDSVSSQTAQWSSWVRCQVLKYCLDLSICLFIYHTPFWLWSHSARDKKDDEERHWSHVQCAGGKQSRGVVFMFCKDQPV